MLEILAVLPTATPFHIVIYLHGTVVEQQCVTGELSLSCARPAADG